ncbi:MAG: lytic transglycosylase domain-containing protein [Polyangiales bacterium]
MIASNVASAELLLDILSSLETARGTTAVAATYHKGRVLERTGRSHDAIEQFRAVLAKRAESKNNFYAIWAESAIRRLSGEPVDKSEGFETTRTSSKSKTKTQLSSSLKARFFAVASENADAYPWFLRAYDLIETNDIDAAMVELHEAYVAWRRARGRSVTRSGLESVATASDLSRPPMDGALRSELASLSEQERGVIAEVAQTFGNVGNAIGFYESSRADEQPDAYASAVVAAANRYGLDPDLLRAVMRVESVFQDRIVSYSGAIGLTQIMPRTGALIAHAIGDEDYSSDDLLDPETNLSYSAWYLASLIRRFNGHVPLAIAAYNGGPHNVRLWMANYNSELPLDALLELIPFTQTHRYVRRVLHHYDGYRRAHQRSTPLLSVSMPARQIDSLAF